VDNEKVLLLDIQHGDLKSFITPGGKVEFPESFVEGAIREVKEETGLEMSNLIYKCLYEYFNPVKTIGILFSIILLKAFRVSYYKILQKVSWYGL
jgi:8-oxo-dGTP diphosphatase